MRRIPSLDGLRAISILFVLLGHASNTPGFPKIPVISHYSGFGVQVFFVISGFLITTLLMKERESTGRISLRGFYRRRAYRILPASVVFLSIITALCRRYIPAINLLAAWTYTVNFMPGKAWNVAHLWSLSVEEQFYLLWPFLLRRWWKWRTHFILFAVISAPLFRMAAYALNRRDLSAAAFPCVYDAIGFGCLLALWRPKLPTRILDRWIVPIVLLTLAFPILRYPHGVQPLIIISLMNLGIVLIVEHCIRKAYAPLNWKPVMWVGWISYSLYLWQQPFLSEVLRRWWTAFPQNLGLALAAACLSYYLIEQPMLRLKDRREKQASLVAA